MQCQPSEPRDMARAFHWPAWPVLAIAFFAFAVNVAFARAAIAGEADASESATGESAVAERPNAEVRQRRREARLAALFANADADEDGRLSTDEFVAADLDRPMRGRGGHRARHRGERGARMDGTPSDGQHDGIHRNEHVPLREEDFAAADKDGSGQLSPQEFEGLPQARREARRKRAFERVDGNGDGYLTVDEFAVRMQRQRRASAAKGDGRSTGSEANP